MNTQIIVYRKSVGIESEVAYICIEKTSSKVFRCFNLQPIKSRLNMWPPSYLFILLIGHGFRSGVHHPETVACAIQHHHMLHDVTTLIDALFSKVWRFHNAALH